MGKDSKETFEPRPPGAGKVSIAVLMLLMLLVLAPLGGMFFAAGQGVSVLRWTLVLVTVPIGLIMLWLYEAGRQLRYDVRGDELLIDLPFRTVSISLTEARGYGESPKTVLPLRTLGASVPGLHLGAFWTRMHGHMTLYATDLDRLLLLVATRTGLVGVTPDDLIGFRAALESRGLAFAARPPAGPAGPGRLRRCAGYADSIRSTDDTHSPGCLISAAKVAGYPAALAMKPAERN